MDKKIILISELEANFNFIAQVSKKMKRKHEFFVDPASAFEYMSENPASALFVDTCTLEKLEAFRKAMRLQDFIVPLENIHCIGNEDFMQNAALEHGAHFLNYLSRPSDILRSSELYSRFLEVLDQGRPFTLDQLWGNEEVHVDTAQLEHQDQKKDVLEAIETWLGHTNFTVPVIQAIINNVDELLMNAWMDAPPTDQKIVDRTVELKTAYDQNFVGISVVDFFGSFDPKRLLNCLTKWYEKKCFVVDLDQKSAGLGLAMILRTGASLIINCTHGMRTEAIFFYRRCDSYNELRNQFRFLSLKTEHTKIKFD